MKKYLFENFPPHAVPRTFYGYSEYPTNPKTGKIDKKALIELFKNRTDAQRELILPTNMLEQQIYDIVKKYTDEEFSINDDLRHFIDSLDSIDVAIDLEELTGEEIDAQTLKDYPSIKVLADVLGKGFQIEMAKAICRMPVNDFENIEIISKLYTPDLSRILLTGSTGFLGSHILHDFIQDGATEKIYCLVRAKDNESGLERLISIYQKYFDEDISNLIGTKIIPFEGDITSKHFNVSPELYSELSNVSLVVNIAANVKHIEDRSLAYTSNVASVQNLISHCLENGIPLAHASTVSIAGNSSTEPQTFDENSFWIGQNIHKNPYLETKTLAEFEILKAIKENGLTAKIFRLGNIMPRFSDGRFQSNDDENGFLMRLKGMAKLRAIPQKYIIGQDLDLSPVDLCSQAIITLLKSSDDQTIYHILNSNKLDLSSVLERIQPEIISIEDFKKRVSNSTDKDIKFLANDFHMLGSAANTISSDATIQRLQPLGFNWNKYTRGYLKKLLKFIMEDSDLELLFSSTKNITPTQTIQEEIREV